MKPKLHQQYQVIPQVFDAYNKDTPIQTALGSERASRKQEAADIRSVNWVPGISGWRLTPRGLELGDSSGVFPPGTITFADIQDIATDKVLGRDTAGNGAIEQLGLGAGLSISGGNLNNTITQYTDENAQDAVGGALTDTNSIDMTYNDGANTISADVKKQNSTTVNLSIDVSGLKADQIAAYQRKSLFDHYADVGNIGTGEDDLYSDTIAASQLANNGEKIEAQYNLTFVTSATATREVKAYFGGTMIFDSGALTFGSTGDANLWITIIRESSSVVRCMAEFAVTGLTLQPISKYTRVTGLTLTSTQILKITGEAAGVGAATDDIVAKIGAVEWKAAA